MFASASGRRFWTSPGASGRHEGNDDGDRRTRCSPPRAHTAVLRPRRGKDQRLQSHGQPGGADGSSVISPRCGTGPEVVPQQWELRAHVGIQVPPTRLLTDPTSPSSRMESRHRPDVEMPVIRVDPEPALRRRKPAVDDATHGNAALAEPEGERFRFTLIADAALHTNCHGLRYRRSRFSTCSCPPPGPGTTRRIQKHK